MMSQPSIQTRASAIQTLGSGQTLGRGFLLLRLVAHGPARGLSLNEIAELSALHRATAHRLLATLVRENLVRRDEAHRYHPAVDLWILGEAAARRFDVREFGRAGLERIAAETQDTAYLSVRSGMHSVCVGRCEGAFPIRTLSLNVGDRRPLGVGSGSLALLSFQPESDRGPVIERIGAELGRYPSFSTSLIRRLVEETRERAYSFVGGTVLPGMAAVGVPLLDRSGHALA